MTKEKIEGVVYLYRSFFESNKIPKQKYDNDLNPTSNRDALAHVHAMLDEIEKFCKEGKIGKAFRWLGFVQGVLWVTWQFNIEELKNHNRS